MADPAEVQRAVLEAVAATCRIAVGRLDASVCIDDLGLDSMALTAVITRLEIRYELSLQADEIVRLLQSKRIAELAAHFAAMLAARPGFVRDAG